MDGKRLKLKISPTKLPPLKSNNDFMYEAYERIDAAMFSGDSFVDSENRAALMYYMARWIKELPEWEAIDREFNQS